MFSFKQKEQQGNRCLGISFHRDSVSLAVVEHGHDSTLAVNHLDHRAIAGSAGISGELKIMVSEAGARGIPAVLVLDQSDYSLLLVEAPDVSDSELKNAVKWRIKDLIDFSVEEAVIELIPLPASMRPGAPHMLYVVVAHVATIERHVDRCDELGLTVSAIDVPELALRNMTFAESGENRAHALLYLSGKHNLIEICKNGSLFLSRHINIDFAALSLEQSDRRAEMLDLLSLEVQRSLDYYESQYADGAVSVINFNSSGEVSFDDFTEVAGSYLMQPVEELKALQQLPGLEKFSHKAVAQCLPALGGALRDFVWTP